MQTRRQFTSSQEKLPGTHLQSTHTPAEHVCVAPHAVVVAVSPSALHTCRLLPLHVTEPGMQAHAPQSPVVALQLFIAGHAMVAP